MLCAILTCSLGAARARAQAPDWRAQRTEVLAQTVSTLETLADWCNSNEVFVERDRLFELILRVDPENFRARKGLKHVQTHDGAWVPPDKPVPPKNFNPGMAAKFPERRRNALTPACDALFALIEANALADEDRELLYVDILGFDPDNVRVHDARGEAKLGDAWVLRETVAGKERRPQLKAEVRAALAGVAEPEAFLLAIDEPTCGTTWPVAIRTPSVRLLSTGEHDDAVKLVRHASATGALLQDLFALPSKERKPVTIYVLGHPNERRNFLQNHPDVRPERVESLVNMVSIGLNVRGDFVTSTENAEQRLDTVVRQTIARVLIDELGIDPTRGWAFEGFGMYLTRELTGTRMTWFALPSNANAEQQALRKKLIGAKSNWMNDAHVLLESARKPDLATLLTKDIDALTIEDLLYSYVLAAYLLEGRPSDASRLLRSLSRAQSAEGAFRETLGMDLATTDLRVRRWLSERR